MAGVDKLVLCHHQNILLFYFPLLSLAGMCVGFVLCVSFGNVCTSIYCVLYCFVYVYVFLLVLSVLPPSDTLIAFNNNNNNTHRKVLM
jgi:hypothetical protein